MSDPPRGPLVYEFGSFRLEPARRVLLRGDGTSIEIAAKAYDALCYLVERAGHPVTREELLKALWPRTIVEDNNLHQAIAAARRALSPEHCIATLQGRGYQFVAPVRILDDILPPKASVSRVAVEPPATLQSARRATLPIAFTAAAVVLAAGVSLVALDGADPTGLRDTQLGAVVRVSRVTTYPGDEYSPSLSPDGSRVAFSWNGVGGNRDIYVALVEGSAVPQRLTTAPEADGDPAWSPDGTRIAFLRRVTARQRYLIVIPALGGHEQLLRSIFLRSIEAVNLTAPKLTWTADGKHLLFASGQEGDDGTRIYALLPATGAATQLTSGGPPYDNSPALSPSGEWLAFRRDPSNPSVFGDLMVQRLGAGYTPIGEPLMVPVPLQARALLHSPSWSTDSRFLVYVAGSNLYEWELGGATSRLISAGSLGGQSAGGEVGALALHRGARPIGVATRFSAGADIFGLPLDAARRVASGPPKLRFFSTLGDAQPRFSPDGSRVVFQSTRGGTSQLWIAAADESWVRPLTALEADEVTYPSWSPDGRQIAFYTSVHGEYQVHVVDAEGGLPRPLFAGGGPAWSLDNRHLYVIEGEAPYTTARVRVADGHREPLFSGVLAHESVNGDKILYWRLGEPSIFARSLSGDPSANREEALVVAALGPIAPAHGGFYYIDVTAEGTPRAFMFYDFASRASHQVGLAPPGVIAGPGGLTVSPDGTELLYAALVGESGADLALFEFEPSTRGARP